MFGWYNSSEGLLQVRLSPEEISALGPGTLEGFVVHMNKPVVYSLRLSIDEDIQGAIGITQDENGLNVYIKNSTRGKLRRSGQAYSSLGNFLGLSISEDWKTKNVHW